MNKYRLTFLLVLILVTGSLYSQEGTTTLKVITYNIWNGFEWGEDSIRHKKAINWIKSQDPDVLALQELNGYTNDKLLLDAKEWGHSYAEILKTTGYPVGITSNKPIAVKEKILENMHHGALHCQTWGIDFLVVHFSPHSYKKRHEEAHIILAKLSEIAKHQDNYIVLGDFNAVSPFDSHFYTGNEEMMISMKESEKKHDHVRNLLVGELDYGPMSAYLGFPLIDVVQKFTNELDERVSCPTQVFEKEKGEGRPPNSKRIDYIMVSPYLGKACHHAKVFNGEETFYLSDHYPVMAQFEF